MKIFLSFFLVVFSVLLLHPQRNPDSLRYILNNSKTDRTTLQKYINQLQAMTPDETASMQVIVAWVIKNTTADSLREIQAMANLALGKMQATVLNLEAASRYLTIALGTAEKNDFFSIQVQAMNAIGAIYERNQQTGQATEYYKKSLAISKKK